MATIAQPGNFNFSPTILPPTTGDLEEARIKRLLDLARLAELQQAPVIQQQQLNLQQRRQAMEEQGQTRNSQHLTAEEQNWANMFGLNQQEFGEKVHEFDTKQSSEAAQHSAALKEDLQKNFLHALVTGGLADATTMPKLATAAGLPEFATALAPAPDAKQQALEDALRASGKLPAKTASTVTQPDWQAVTKPIAFQGPTRTGEPLSKTYDQLVGFDTLKTPSAVVATPSATPTIREPSMATVNPSAFMQDWLMKLIKGSNWRPPI